MTGREPPPPYQTAAEVLDSVRALYADATDELRRGIAAIPNEDHTARLWRAQTYALVASAGAEVAQAMLVGDDVDADEELDRQLGPYPTPLGRPPALPNATDGSYLDRLERWRDDIADAARVATDEFKAPEVTGPAAAEVQRLLRDIPYREEQRG